MSAVLCCLAVGIGCQGEGDGDPADRRTTTLRLSADDSGDLATCDANGECQSLPNPNDCATLVIEIDNANGETCETCLDANDQVVYATCEEPSVACEVITLPEPDCMVCAHVNGAIVYSSCVTPPEEPVRGECKLDSDCAQGGTCVLAYPDCAAPPMRCDENGDCYEEESDCGGEPVGYCMYDVCALVDCAMPMCEPGFHVETSDPYQCCGSCVPDGCSFDADCAAGYHCEGSSVCPPGMECIWAGEPGVCVKNVDCSNFDCAEILCPEGTHLERDFNQCCGGECVADAPTCFTSENCPDGQRCSTEDGDCRASCAPGMACDAVCSGFCHAE